MVIPYLKPYAKELGDRGGKSGSVQYEGNRIHMSGTMEYYNLHYCSEAAVITDGTMRCGTDGITIDKATEIFLYSTFGTNYELRPEVFLQEDPQKKLRDFDPVESVLDRVESALKKGYEALYEAHVQDSCQKEFIQPACNLVDLFEVVF